jgi:hypothetical protein
VPPFLSTVFASVAIADGHDVVVVGLDDRSATTTSMAHGRGAHPAHESDILESIVGLSPVLINSQVWNR